MGSNSPWGPRQRAIINLMHVVPHLNGQFEAVSNTFDYLQPHNGFLKYVFSIFPIPIIIFFCGFIVWILVFSISIKLSEKAAPYMNLHSFFNISEAVFYSVLLVSMLINFYFIEESLRGLRVFVDNLSEIQNLASTLLTLVHDLSRVEEQFQAGFSSCSSIVPASLMTSSSKFINELVVKTALFQHRLEHFSLDYAIASAENLVEVLTIALYTVQAITFAIVLAEAICACTFPSSKFDALYTLISIHTLTVFLVLLILMTVIMILLIFMADFCIDPVGSTLSFVDESWPSPSKSQENPFSTYSITKYYLTCNESFPLAGYVETASLAIARLSNIVDKFPPNMGLPMLDTCITNVDMFVSNATSLISNISSIADCQNLNNIFVDAVEQGLCTTSYLGFFAYWWFQIFAILFLIGVIVTLISAVARPQSFEVLSGVDFQPSAPDEPNSLSNSLDTSIKTSGPREVELTTKKRHTN